MAQSFAAERVRPLHRGLRSEPLTTLTGVADALNELR
jgi:hypothetical protein